MWIFKAPIGLTDFYVVVICYLLTMTYVDGGKKNKGKKSQAEETEAMERLSRVFGIEHAPQHNVHSTPPQFMLELFNDITDSGGLIKKDGPYNASTIVSFPDRAYNKEMHFYYNVSMHSSDHLLESEFHLFRMTPKSNHSRHSLPHSRLSHLIQIKVYQVLDPNNMYSDQGRHLLDHKRVRTHDRGWVIFNVTRAVRQWASGQLKNYGFLVLSETIQGDQLGEDEVRFAQRKAHHDTKQPILVVYTNDGRHRTPHYISPQDQEYKEIRRDIRRLEKKYQRKMRYRYDNAGLQTAIKFLNEKDREEYGHPFFTRKNSVNNSRRKRNADLSTSANSDKSNRKNRTGRKGKRDTERRFSKHRKSCNRRQMYVDFDEIGWAGWIISPKGYNAYHCKGACPFPLGQSQRPTNHATVQSIVHALRVGKGVSTPCCVPNKLYSISLLYFDDAENVILKQYDDMVAASCGCH
ncbi:bone morphogenetic protein 2-like [Mercenaria mercenaria]|uniref:bone morphogenetic protein 2-like n=1 Tax=Mercenaria mercenaria TaxID=6596 RepID=UPI00234E8356|nr:bone morphogenetic protein 2-like [Mercenaria mercenaria]